MPPRTLYLFSTFSHYQNQAHTPLGMWHPLYVKLIRCASHTSKGVFTCTPIQPVQQQPTNKTMRESIQEHIACLQLVSSIFHFRHNLFPFVDTLIGVLYTKKARLMSASKTASPLQLPILSLAAMEMVVVRGMLILH